MVHVEVAMPISAPTVSAVAPEHHFKIGRFFTNDAGFDAAGLTVLGKEPLCYVFQNDEDFQEPYAPDWALAQRRAAEVVRGFDEAVDPVTITTVSLLDGRLQPANPVKQYRRAIKDAISTNALTALRKFAGGPGSWSTNDVNGQFYPDVPLTVRGCVLGLDVRGQPCAHLICPMSDERLAWCLAAARIVAETVDLVVQFGDGRETVKWTT